MNKRWLLLTIFMGLIMSSCASPTLYTNSPQDLVLQAEDMPGEYVVMDALSGKRPNEELSMESDKPEALIQYLEGTGRIIGWENHFMLMESTQILPGFIINQVVVYETPEGAQAAIDWPSVQSRQLIQTERNIGDIMIFTMMPFEAPGNLPWIDYKVEFAYKNLTGSISTFAPEEIASPDYALDLAELLFQRFQKALSR